MPSVQHSGRGDHRVLVNVAVPRKLTDEQRELLDRFEALSGEDTYRRDEGFFEKLRSALPLTHPHASLGHRPAARSEEARAVMLELFPEGFEEIEGEGGLELAAYTNAAGEERIWQAFGGAASADVEEDWEDRWRAVPQAGPRRPALDRPAVGGARRRTRSRS